MGKVFADHSISLDGFSAGPNVGMSNPMGDGGEEFHAWQFRGGRRASSPSRMHQRREAPARVSDPVTPPRAHRRPFVANCDPSHIIHANMAHITSHKGSRKVERVLCFPCVRPCRSGFSANAKPGSDRRSRVRGALHTALARLAPRERTRPWRGRNRMFFVSYPANNLQRTHPPGIGEARPACASPPA